MAQRQGGKRRRRKTASPMLGHGRILARGWKAGGLLLGLTWEMRDCQLQPSKQEFSLQAKTTNQAAFGFVHHIIRSGRTTTGLRPLADQAEKASQQRAWARARTPPWTDVSI